MNPHTITKTERPRRQNRQSRSLFSVGVILIPFLIGIILFIWIVNFIGLKEIENAFLIFSGFKGLIILILTFLTIIIGLLKWKEILKDEGINISIKNLFRPYLAGFSIMYFLPMIFFGGEIFRGYILKKRNSIPFSKGMASVIIDRISEWTCSLVLIFFGILFLLKKIGLPTKDIRLIIGATFLIFLFGISFFYFKVFKKQSMIKFFLKKIGFKSFNGKNSILEVEKEIFNFFRPKKKLMWKAFAISFLKVGIMYFRTIILIIFLGGKIGNLSALSILGFSYLAIMIPIPTALGSHEAIQAFVFNSFGLGFSTATAFTMIIRGAEIIIAIIGIFILFKLGIDLFKKTLYKKINNFNRRYEI